MKSRETSDEMALKPMNCPHHTQIFASQPRSYRDMPVRHLETTTGLSCDEKTGELGGLNRAIVDSGRQPCLLSSRPN